MMHYAAPILAFNDPWHDSSFFFSGRGSVVHVECERRSRRKHDYINPILAFCDLYPDLIESFEHIAVHEGGVVTQYLRHLVRVKAEGGTAADLPPMPMGEDWLVQNFGPASFRNDTDNTHRFIRHLMKAPVSIYFCGHHGAHAANAFYSSNFDSALSVTLDGGGLDLDMTRVGTNAIREDLVNHPSVNRRQLYGSVYNCRDNRCTPLFQLMKTSIGTMWHRVVTGLLELKEGEEGTAMAMAALGDPARFRIWIDRPCAVYRQNYALEPAQHAEIASWLEEARRQIVTDQDRYDVAAALQAGTEARVRAFLTQHVTRDVSRLCLSGGTFLNCQITGKIRDWFPWLDDIFIPPAPYDGGLSIGAAQLVHHEVLGARDRISGSGLAPFALGRSYDRADVVAAAARHGLRLSEAGPEAFIERVAAGEAVGLFQGGAESGRRALGHRSIIAHPGIAGLKDRLNSAIKHRQWFRPFAPMVLAEEVHDWFDCPPGFTSPYMSFAVPVKAARRDLIANVVHLDGTARLQTVHRGLSPALHGLLSLWHQRSGIPVLLNTSFNDREPIVETPDDALATFARTPIDAVYFADHNLIATKQPKATMAAR
ncbi:MAG: hypothetical protein KDK89_18050 [Alphaproteobacteria bacterium]|nr:hypothetical protein [Alphaproteobacteria bacterium]